MKTLNKVLLAVAATSVLMTGANAAVYNNGTTYNTGTTHNVFGYAGQPYIGLKAGQFNTDLDNVDKPTAYGVYGGYQFDRNWGAEAEYMGSDKADVTLNGSKVGTVKAETYGLYGTYKYGFPNTAIYGKAKLGVAHNQLKAEDSLGSDKISKTSIAGGLGLGYNISPQVAIEAEYAFLPKPSVDDSDIKSDLWTIGAHMKF